MFDPTIFDNLKVVLENHLYDLDNLSGSIHITNRIDRLEMATMSREFALRFELADQEAIAAEIRLHMSLDDLASEILEMPNKTPGCTLVLRFYMEIDHITKQCQRIEKVLQHIWQPDVPPVQTISFMYGPERPVYSNVIELAFNRKINENQMGDIPEIVDHMLRTLAQLGEL